MATLLDAHSHVLSSNQCYSMTDYCDVRSKWKSELTSGRNIPYRPLISVAFH